ncbi:unnamed protein product [Medioppia subpectinata]|uniref:Uncharacterized protein n=1 Tax=Medioppia subpectinata TaxID=1979941 RepID=A0A7R9KYJ8_9ACAR|nr:unnamed protein product [Medioppia subpectinata]CAG2111097.1 unnamed protein product [Medioppia subpectinata]
MILLLSINTAEPYITMLIKLVFFTLASACLVSYLLIYQNSSTMFEIHAELNTLYSRYGIPGRNRSAMVYVGLHMLCYISGALCVFYDNVIDRFFKISSFNLLFSHHAALSLFYTFGWITMLQHLYFELCYKYLNVLDHMLGRMRALRCMPSTEHLFDMTQIIENFVIDDQSHHSGYGGPGYDDGYGDGYVRPDIGRFGYGGPHGHHHHHQHQQHRRQQAYSHSSHSQSSGYNYDGGDWDASDEDK